MKYSIKTTLFLPFFFILSINGFAAERFLFKHNAGSQYRILSIVSEDVFYNGQFSHHSDISNKVSVAIKSTTKDSNEIEVGEIESTFYITEDYLFQDQHFSQLTNTYKSHFYRDKFGRYTQDEDDMMPVVRNAPLFPDKELEVGESWKATGYEVHDFSKSPFFIKNPFRFPVEILYRYEGKDMLKDKEYDKFSINYKALYTVPQQNSGLINGYNNSYRYGNQYQQTLRPSQIFVASTQTLYWDNTAGRPFFYNEQFNHIIALNDGSQIEFRGTAEAIVLDSQDMDKKNLKDEISKELEASGLKDVKVVEKDEGLALILDNIQFYPDSSQILPGEEKKLDAIATILNQYKERDIKITGHTARAGTVEEQDRLSLERATVIADHFIKTQVRQPVQILIEGKGSREPIASNSNEIGRKKNRRVEILILEN